MTTSNPLSPEELKRYARHIVLPEVGGAGQQAMKRARVLVIGAGGIGSPVLLYLAAAGIGTIGVTDNDAVSLSNLQRQVLHGVEDIGRPKIESAAAAIATLNPHVTVEQHNCRIDEENGGSLVSSYDLVIDGSDNFATRFGMADLCEREKRPLVTAAVNRFSGSITTLVPFQEGKDGHLNPGYRDLFPAPPPEGLVPSCAEAGILGIVPGILGTLAAAEAIKLVCGLGDLLIGRLLLVDCLTMRFDEVRYKRRKS
ncbi:HesA/MoeB/ThiF family protein [Consotaella salsifontis]|uniref:Molybdopterin-synthase adenylyltransferase n=1 Tax=Consotaella salsifontis TaxID=1365950 RepID=A0A1T4RQ14_9HYPH|nr:molybdopterin-synthase adenylyltransferase MoeB [Consotaella salsifontis]SKA18032.1 Molybdopterin or thiamine biosynthesis adenylyltransferase [Consotaella salsifontis]